MHRLNLISSAIASLLAIAGPIAPAVNGAETRTPGVTRAAAPAPRTSRWVLFSPADIARARETLAEEKRREHAFRTAHPELPLIELAPFVVEGDNSLLLAALRREMELGPESIRRRVAELSPMLSRQAIFSARSSDRFFNMPTPGAPGGRPAIGMVSAQRLMQVFREPIANIFKPPGGW